MRLSDWTERLGNVGAALRRRAADDARMRWSRDELAAHQRARLRELVRHATTHSPFYRAHYGGVIDRDIELRDLPVITKNMMMEHFDQFVTDRRLRRADLLNHITTIRGDDLHLGEFRVMTSSGSSGQKAIFVYDRAAWRGGFMTASLRLTRLTGFSPRLPRPRMATVAAGDGKHMTFRGGASMDIGLFRTHRFSASDDVSALARDLTAYKPDLVLGYPSMLALLADAQQSGRLDIAPRIVISSSEVCTPAMRAAIRAAWHIEPYDCLGLTETGIAALDCHLHRGLHVFEDLCIFEVEPDGRLLVTNLYNRVQPIIRYEVGDLLTIDDTPCACGITMRRIVALDGRSDDLLELPGDAGTITVHPIHVRGILGREPSVVQYQVVQSRERVDVDVVLASGTSSEMVSTLERALTTLLRDRGARVEVRVRAVPAIAREAGAGKLKLVRRV